MKILSLLIVFGALLFSSCTKDSDTTNPDNSDVYLTCKIDGTAFSAEPLTVGGTSTGSNFSVQGNGSGLDALSISIVLIRIILLKQQVLRKVNLGQNCHRVCCEIAFG